MVGGPRLWKAAPARQLVLTMGSAWLCPVSTNPTLLTLLSLLWCPTGRMGKSTTQIPNYTFPSGVVGDVLHLFTEMELARRISRAARSLQDELQLGTEGLAAIKTKDSFKKPMQRLAALTGFNALSALEADHAAARARLRDLAETKDACNNLLPPLIRNALRHTKIIVDGEASAHLHRGTCIAHFSCSTLPGLLSACLVMHAHYECRCL